MKTVTVSFYSLPLDVAAKTLEFTKDMVISYIKKDRFEEASDLLFTLQQMEEQYKNATKEGMYCE